jgi:hypothetical protein
MLDNLLFETRKKSLIYLLNTIIIVLLKTCVNLYYFKTLSSLLRTYFKKNKSLIQN